MKTEKPDNLFIGLSGFICLLGMSIESEQWLGVWKEEAETERVHTRVGWILPPCRYETSMYWNRQMVKTQNTYVYMKAWKLPKTRIRNLIKCGVKAYNARQWGYCKGYWRVSGTPIMHMSASTDNLRRAGYCWYVLNLGHTPVLGHFASAQQDIR